MAAVAAWAAAIMALVLDTSGAPPMFLGIVAATVTLLTMHVRTRLPAVDVFEHGYRAGWADREAMDELTPSYPPDDGRVVSMRPRQKVHR